jgi:hypothetical protein
MANQPSSPAAQPPPDLPSLPGASAALTNYLTRFSLWCRQGFAAKLNANSALPGIMLMAYDAPSGTTPAVWLVRVNTAGVVSTLAVPLGGADPETSGT